MPKQYRAKRVAAVVVAVAIIAGAVALWHRANEHATVAGPKESAPADVRMNVIVVPANGRVRQVLDRSDVVQRYALLSRGALPTNQSLTASWHDAACALLEQTGFVVQTQTNAALGELRRSLERDARVFEVTPSDAGDVEVFMHVGATSPQIEAVRRAIAADTREVAGYHFVDHNAAYAEFKRTFANQPDLIAGTPPAALPESFRIVATEGTSLDVLQNRFRRLAGVDNVVTKGRLSDSRGSPGSAKSADCQAP